MARAMGRARVLALALAFVLGAPAHGATVRDPSCRTVAFVPRAGVLTFRLDPFLRPGSDSLWSASGAWVRGRDYRVDPLRGDLRLLRAPVPGETLRVSACRLLTAPPLEVVRERYRPPGSVAAADAADTTVVALVSPRAATARDPGGSPGGASLTLAGNKTIAVEFGSTQDATLRQSLDLSVTGTLAPGVELTGVLSDRSTPLSAAGATQDLQSLDRILVELRAPNGSAALGDVALALDQGEFARLERRLQGARGEWRAGALTLFGAAASAQGEYHRLPLNGIEGQQGPYALTDRAGGTGITVVAGSEVVTLDGVRLVRGETADYVMDYERARLTFSNRRPIGASSRITVEYQYAVTRYKRNLATGGARWQQGPLSLFAHVLAEGDDRGRPLDLTLGATERLVLGAAGDSAQLAVGPGVSAGPGDYDSVRVAGGLLTYAWAGADSGEFVVRFARVAEGAGDYVDSTTIGGRTAYRWVGAGLGRFVLGRALPLAESQQLATVGGRFARGGFVLEGEGALSRFDRNTFSTRDDADDGGLAGRVAVGFERALPARWGRAAIQVTSREVGRRFTALSRLERPFAEEDWGLPAGADLEHQRRTTATARWTRGTGETRLELARLVTPDGYAGWKRGAEWRGGGALSTQASWMRSDGSVLGRRFGDAGRERWQAGVRWAAAWAQPALRFESDRRDVAADTGLAGERWREWGAELATGTRSRWRASLGASTRRDAAREGGGARDLRDVRTWSAMLETPAGGRLGAAFTGQRRDVRPLGDPTRSRADLASLRLRADDRERGLGASFQLELTSEGENRRSRELRFVGPGLGAYDSLGNFVGSGSYDLVLVVGAALDRVARAAASGRAAWTFGGSDAWRGSRIEFATETEARRRGALRGADAWLTPGAPLRDGDFARATVTHRLDAELAPGARVATVIARLERRVSADRSYSNFAQTTDQRTAQLRWRVRPGTTVTVESEGRMRWQRAEQRVTGGAAFARTLQEPGAQATVAWQPGARLRADGAFEASWSRPEAVAGAAAVPFTRTLRAGPDVGLSVGARGRLDLSARRAFVSGPPVLGLIPSVDPAGAPRWDATARADVRVRESVTFGVTAAVRDYPGRRTVTNGRAELRAFF